VTVLEQVHLVKLVNESCGNRMPYVAMASCLAGKNAGARTPSSGYSEFWTEQQQQQRGESRIHAAVTTSQIRSF